MRNHTFTILLMIAAMSTAMAQDPHADDRQALLKIMVEIEGAINKRDFSAVGARLMPSSVVIFQDTTVARGPAEIEAYYERMLGDAASILTGISVKAEVDGPATFLDDNTAVANGHTTDTFEFRTGTTMELRTAWSTTVVRRDGQWYVAALHFSNNLFDNPIANGTKRLTWIAAAAGFVLGVILMFVLGRILRRK